VQTVAPPDGSVTTAKLGSLTDVTLTGDLTLGHDGAIINFGTDSDVTLTHVHDTGIKVTGVGHDFVSNSYNVIKIQTDANDDGSSDDSILQFTNGSSNTVKGEIRYDESESVFEIGAGDNQGHVRIDANGVVAIPNIPCFSVTAGNQSWSGSNNEQVIQFNSEDVDNGGHFNTTNYRFTAPVTGHYFFTIHGHMNTFSTSGAGGPGVFLRKNGSSSTTVFMYMYYTGYKGSSVQGCIQLDKDDYVTGAAINYNSSSFTLGGLRMSGFLLG